MIWVRSSSRLKIRLIGHRSRWYREIRNLPKLLMARVVMMGVRISCGLRIEWQKKCSCCITITIHWGILWSKNKLISLKWLVLRRISLNLLSRSIRKSKRWKIICIFSRIISLRPQTISIISKATVGSTNILKTSKNKKSKNRRNFRKPCKNKTVSNKQKAWILPSWT